MAGRTGGKAPISESYESEHRGNTATGRGRSGRVENEPRLRCSSVRIVEICALLAPCRRPILNATTHHYMRDGTLQDKSGVAGVQEFRMRRLFGL